MEVARRAGISHQTVSRVLNSENTVYPQWHTKVEDAIRKLRYRPTSVARALATRKMRTPVSVGVNTGNQRPRPPRTARA